MLLRNEVWYSELMKIQTSLMSFVVSTCCDMYPSTQLSSVKLFAVSGLEADGIYRVSGNLATIQKLRFIVDQGKKQNVFYFIK